jgi:hypothetical protein
MAIVRALRPRSDHVNPVTHGNARGLPVADRRSNAPIGQVVSRVVVADQLLHEALIEPPFRPSGSSVDCANGGRRFSRQSVSGRAIRRLELFWRIFFCRNQNKDLRQVHAPPNLTN